MLDFAVYTDLSFSDGQSSHRGSVLGSGSMGTQDAGATDGAAGGTAGGLTGPLQGQDMRSQLLQARTILELGLENVSYARQVVALTDGKSIADVGWAQVFISVKYVH